MAHRAFVVIVVAGVLGLAILCSTFRSQMAIGAAQFAAEEQAGSLVDSEEKPFGIGRAVPIEPKAPEVVLPRRSENVARRGKEPIEQQVRVLHEQLKSRLSKGEKLSSRDVELKKSIDRYFADSRIEHAIELLESVVKEAGGTPEAARAQSAIQVLKNQATDAIESNSVLPRKVRKTAVSKR
jgi:hypothetical protein